MEELKPVSQMISSQAGELPKSEYQPETKAQTKKRLEAEAARFNKAVVEPTDGIYCNLCGNKLTIARVIEANNDWYVEDILCSCNAQRNALRKRKASGMEEAIDTVGKFEANEEWQKIILTKAREFVGQSAARCFYIGGQSGSGKTHISTLICRTLIDRGMPLLYRKWSETIKSLNDYRNEERDQLMKELKNIKVLYLDDFFKPAGSNAAFSPAEIRTTFDIIDSRYISHDKITIFSSELTSNELFKVDTAIARRITEMTGNRFMIDVQKDMSHMYRRVDYIHKA